MGYPDATSESRSNDKQMGNIPVNLLEDLLEMLASLELNDLDLIIFGELTIAKLLKMLGFDDDDLGTIRRGIKNYGKGRKSSRVCDPCDPRCTTKKNSDDVSVAFVETTADYATETTSNSISNNSNAATLIGKAGTSTVDIKLRTDSNISEYIARSKCISVPLKAGGNFSFAWNSIPNMSYLNLLPVWEQDPTGHLPAGRGGFFSFFPYIALASTGSSERYRLAEHGIIHYKAGNSLSGVTNYSPVNPISYEAKEDSSTKEFTEYNIPLSLF